MSLPAGTPVKVMRGGSFVSGVLRVWNATLGQWVTPKQVIPVSAIPTAQTTLLPFNQAAYTGAPKVFAHYFTQFPLQPGGNTTDYWVHWTKPGAVEAASTQVTGVTSAAAAASQAAVTVGTANAAKLLVGDHISFGTLSGLYAISAVNTTTGVITLGSSLVVAVPQGTAWIAIRGGTDNRVAGGYVRDRTMSRYYSTLADANAAEIADMVTEITWAIAGGIDGFWVDLLGMPGTYHWTRLLHLFAAADQVYANTGKRFWIAPMPDGSAQPSGSSGGVNNTSADALANALLTLKTQASYWKIGTDFVVPVFGPELTYGTVGDTRLNFWTRVKATMASGGMTTKYIFCYVGDWTALGPTYNGIVYGHSRWGDRDATAVAAANNYNRNAPSYCHTTFPGKTWTHFGAPGDTRPNSGGFAVSAGSYLTWENKGFSALNGTWRAAIDGGADFIQCTTWNDFSESAHIVPSLNNSFALLDLMSFYAQWFKSGTQPTIVRDALYLSHRVAPTGQQVAAMPGTKQLHFAQKAGATNFANVADVTAFLTSAATIQFLVDGAVVGTAAGVSGYNRFEFALPANGTISARAQRSGATVAGTTVSSDQPVHTTGNLADDYHYRAYSSLRQAAITAPAGYSVYPNSPANFAAGVNASTKTYLPPGTYTFADFASGVNYGASCPSVVGFAGAGEGITTILMSPNTSTKAAAANGLALYATNPYHLLKFGPTSGSDGSGPKVILQDFTLEATPQGHNFGGLRIDYTQAPEIRRVQILGCPGSLSGGYAQPPGETFYPNLFRSPNGIIDTCDFDGRMNGVKVGCSIVGINNSDNTTILNSWIHHSAYGIGVAAWQSTGGTITGTTFQDLWWAPVHIEKCDGVWNLRNCVWRDTNHQASGVWIAHSYHVHIDGHPAGDQWRTGLVTLNIYDPDYDDSIGDGKFHVLVQGTQSKTVGTGTTPGAINLYVGGHLRPDLLVVH